MSDYIFGKNQPPHKRWCISWYNPFVLWRSLREMMSTSDQLRNLDRREMYSPHLELIQVAEEKRNDDFWWDFVSDSGDGGNATYTVAREMQKDFLVKALADDLDANQVLPEKFPKGELLVLGGDLAYPGACVEEYQYRLTEMWVASSPDQNVQEDRDALRPSLAIPQNHDWFDNISTFSRYFVNAGANDFGMKLLSAETETDLTPLGTRKLQKQSYFAARLPNDWVILGFDFALVGDIDRQQFAAFYKLFKSKTITPDCNLILLYPEPYWSRGLGDAAREGYPKRYQRLEAFILKMGGRIRVRMAGDIHHYARETAKADSQFAYEDMLIISGGGGAFLHPTHSGIAQTTKVMNLDYEEGALTEDLRARVRIGIANPKDTSIRSYDEKIFYPRRHESVKLLIHNLWSFFRSAAPIGKQLRDCKSIAQRLSVFWQAIIQGNIMFSVLLGGLLLSAMFTKAIWPGLIITVMFFGIGKESSLRSGFAGAAAGLGLVLLVEHFSYLLAPDFISHTEKWYDFSLYAWWGLIYLGCFSLSGLFTGIYFSLCSLLGYLPNNAFSPLGYEGYKSFIRFRIDRDGNLHGYVWGTDDVPRYWKANPEAKQPVWVEKDKRKAEWRIRDTFTLHK
jgi:hypothetical protein